MLTPVADIARAEGIAPHQQIRGSDSAGQLDRVGDGTGRAGAYGQRQESLIDSVSVRETKGHVACTQVDVDTQFVPQHLDGSQRSRACVAIRANSKHKRIDHNII